MKNRRRIYCKHCIYCNRTHYTEGGYYRCLDRHEQDYDDSISTDEPSNDEVTQRIDFLLMLGALDELDTYCNSRKFDNR